MANYIYNRSAQTWQRMYSTYVSKYWQAAASKGGFSEAYARSTPMSPEQFKASYIMARNTNLDASRKKIEKLGIKKQPSAGNVYKTLIERDRTSPFTLTRTQAKVMQKAMKDSGLKAPTQKELMLKGGENIKAYNKYLKQRYPNLTGKQRAQQIGEVFFGSK